MREQEDETCTAGLRNTALLTERYKPMQAVIDTLAPIMNSFISAGTDAPNLHKAGGKLATRGPPAGQTGEHIRMLIGEALWLQNIECEWTHPLRSDGTGSCIN